MNSSNECHLAMSYLKFMFNLLIEGNIANWLEALYLHAIYNGDDYIKPLNSLLQELLHAAIKLIIVVGLHRFAHEEMNTNHKMFTCKNLVRRMTSWKWARVNCSKLTGFTSWQWWTSLSCRSCK